MSPHLVYAENQILLGRFSLQLSRSPSPVDGSVFARVLATSRLNGYVLKFVFVFKSEPHSKLVFVHFPLELLIAFFCHLPCFLSLFTFFFWCVYMCIHVCASTYVCAGVEAWETPRRPPASFETRLLLAGSTCQLG